jgi:DNA modification methylase
MAPSPLSVAPRPYYEADGISIFHGDCAVIAPTLGAFDLLCTDPPYGIGEARNERGGKRHGAAVVASRDYGSSDWDDAPPSQALIDSCRAMARHQCIFGGNYFALPPSRCWLVWDKENGENDYADCELAWTNYARAVRRKRHQWHGMIRVGHEERFHPTQKPLAVMSWAIDLCPVAPSTVFDPFVGSGTTLVAAKLSGRRAVGIEREERYCEIAAKRCAMTREQGVLALGAP